MEKIAQTRLKVTFEKQKNWKKEFLEEKISYGVDGFTVTDIPFSTVLQAYWFLVTYFFDFFIASWLSKISLGFKKFWEDTDSFVFYNSVMGDKKYSEGFQVFWKLQRRLLDHPPTINEIEGVPRVIGTLAINGRSEKDTEKRLINLLEKLKNQKALGIFIVSGGGVFQNYFKHLLSFFGFRNISSSKVIQKIDQTLVSRNEEIKIFAAVNTNYFHENIGRLKEKNAGKNIYGVLTQPPFLWSRFTKFMQDLQADESLKNISVRVGIPAITNPWNIRFWLMLVRVDWRKDEEARTLVRLFEKEWEKDKSKEKSAFKEFSKQWTFDLVKKIQSEFSFVDGLHVMLMGNFITVDDILLTLGYLKNPVLELANDLGVVFEKVKYKNTFRSEVSVRDFPGKREVRLNTSLALKNSYKELEKVRDKVLSFLNNGDSSKKYFLEKNFVSQSESLIWKFNLDFWNDLNDFMLALGKDYKRAIGGSAESNQKLMDYCVENFLRKFSTQVEAEEIVYLEVGAASTEWARKFLQTIYTQNKNIRLKYVFLDFSHKVLEAAKADLGEDYLGLKVEYEYVGDKNSKEIFFKKYLNRVSVVHATNVYDNFSFDRLVKKDKNIYTLKIRSYLPEEGFQKLIKKYESCGLTASVLEKLMTDLLETGKTTDFLENLKRQVAGEKNFYSLWQDFWNYLVFEEKCEILSTEEIQEKSFYKKILESESENFEINISKEIIDDLRNNMLLLSSYGYLEIIDIIAKQISDFQNFLGPIKYDASLATYVNLPEIEESLNVVSQPFKKTVRSLEDFGGRKNQSILILEK